MIFVQIKLVTDTELSGLLAWCRHCQLLASRPDVIIAATPTHIFSAGHWMLLREQPEDAILYPSTMELVVFVQGLALSFPFPAEQASRAIHNVANAIEYQQYIPTRHAMPIKKSMLCTQAFYFPVVRFYSTERLVCQSHAALTSKSF